MGIILLVMTLMPVLQSWGDSEGNGFKSIGDQDTAFTGVIDGLGHQIKELYIDRKK